MVDNISYALQFHAVTVTLSLYYGQWFHTHIIYVYSVGPFICLPRLFVCITIGPAGSIAQFHIRIQDVNCVISRLDAVVAGINVLYPMENQ